MTYDWPLLVRTLSAMYGGKTPLRPILNTLFIRKSYPKILMERIQRPNEKVLIPFAARHSKSARLPLFPILIILLPLKSVNDLYPFCADSPLFLSHFTKYGTRFCASCQILGETCVRDISAKNPRPVTDLTHVPLIMVIGLYSFTVCAKNRQKTLDKSLFFCDNRSWCCIILHTP